MFTLDHTKGKAIHLSLYSHSYLVRYDVEIGRLVVYFCLTFGEKRVSGVVLKEEDTMLFLVCQFSAMRIKFPLNFDVFILCNFIM